MRTSMTWLAAMLAALIPMAFGLDTEAETLAGELEPYSHYTFSVDCGNDESVDLVVQVTAPGWSVLIESGENMPFGQVNNILTDDDSWELFDNDGEPAYQNVYELISGGGIFYVTIYAKENPGVWAVEWELDPGTVVSGGAAPGYVYDGRRFPYCDAPSILGPGTYRLIAGVDRSCTSLPFCFGIDAGTLTYIELDNLAPGSPCEGKPYEGEGFRITDRSGTSVFISAPGAARLGPGWYQLWPVGGAETVVDIIVTIQ